MKILIVEDDEFKQRRIAQVVKDIDTANDIQLDRSVNSGLKSIVEHRPELILLDMSLTTFDVGPNEPGGRPQNFGGMEILRQMERLGIVIPVVVITQHERFASGSQEVHLSALYEELTERHGPVFKGLIYYNSAAGSWENQLRKLVGDLIGKGEVRDVRKNPRRRRR